VDDPQSFERFYTDSSPAVLAQMYAFTGDLHEAQDIVQEAYTRAWLRWKTVSQYDDPVAWVRSVAWRLSVNRWRHLRVVRGWLGSLRASDESVAPEPSADAVAIAAELKRLPLAQRQALVLHYLADMSVEDIARVMSAPTGTVKSHLSRGRSQLAESFALADAYPEGREKDFHVPPERPLNHA